MNRNLKQIICLSLSCLCLTMAVNAKTSSELRDESSAIKSKLGTAQSNLESAKNEKNAVQSELDKLDKELADEMAELKKLDTHMATAKAKLAKNQNDLELAVDSKNEQYDDLKKRMRVMYEYGDVGYLNVLLGADDFSDLLSRFEYANRIMDYDRTLLNKYKETEQTINKNIKSIEEDKKKIENLQTNQKKKISLVNKKIADKNETVKKLMADEASYQAQVEELKWQDRNIEILIKNAEKREAEEQKTIVKSSNVVYEADKNEFQYPVPAFPGVKPNDVYGSRINPISGKMEFHTGIDLKAVLNSDIVAAADGVITFAGNKGGYGKTVIVDHGNGYSTLYAHNNELRCNAGETVSRGQVIAGAGTTGYSTGVHCHFEVRKNGVHIDPTSFIYKK